MLTGKLVTFAAYSQWQTIVNNPEIIKSFENQVGHEFTEKDLALLGSTFMSGAGFLNNLITESDKPTTL